MYAELHCLSNFSFLRGASHPAELVETASALGYRALAITDECSMAGVVKAHIAAKPLGMQLIIGSEFQLQEPLTVIALAPNHTAYSEICEMISRARRRSAKGSYSLQLHELTALRHCLLIWRPHADEAGNGQFAEILRRDFAGRLWIGATNLLRGDQPERFDECVSLSRHVDIPLLACGEVRMHSGERRPLLDAVTAIRHNCSIDQLGWRRDGNGERHLQPLEELRNRYPRAWLDETLRVAERCRFTLDELNYQYPPEVVPPNTRASEWLRFRVEEGEKKRWPNGTPAAIRAQIEKELALIHEKQYEHFFLTVHDIVDYARSQNILCQGRGSAANSVVCFCLGITAVSPQEAHLLFERFVSKERDEPPDIDVDFEHARREEVIQYIYKKYSRERAALVATVIYYRPRSAVRDIGKALGLSPLFIAQLSESMAWWDQREELVERFREQGVTEDSRIAPLFFTLVQQILGFPRHLSQHVGGFVISATPISHLVPVENAAMQERTVIQWDKDDIEAMHMLKVDVLALGMLTAIHRCFDLIRQHHGPCYDMQSVPQDDAAVYAMLCRADSIGVFQVESRAQMAMLPRLRPQKFYDLVVQVAIVRPGPIQGGMVHPYLRRRQGLEQPEQDITPAIQEILERTLGVPIFQEQVIKLAMVAADFSAGEADQLRRAMATWGKNGDLEKFRDKLVNGMLANGHEASFAERLFQQMKGFGSYGFPESHAASFALLVYLSAWLKHHYPAAFTCALLNSQPMGFYSPSQLVQDARRHGIEVHPVDVNHSCWQHTLENSRGGKAALRLGFALVKGIGAGVIQRLEAARAARPFIHIADLQQRTGLDRDELGALIAAGALKTLSGHRRQAHWQALAIPAVTALEQPYLHDFDDAIALPAPGEVAELRADYNSTGLTLGRHPMLILRERFGWLRQCRRHSELAELNQGRFIRIAGIVTGRQRPGTASGVVFLTLEDETGNTNVVVWRDVQQRYRQALLKARLLLVKGIVERDQSVVHVLAGELIDCSEHLQQVALRSRDFH